MWRSTIPLNSEHNFLTLCVFCFILFFLVYRIDAIGSAIPLILSREALAKIYTAEITWWNDSAIAATNPSVTMPAQRITLVLESTSGATNYIATQAFSKFYSNFTQTMEVSTGPKWPKTKYYNYLISSGTTGVASTVIANDGSIAIIAQPIANALKINVASMINKAGNVVRPTSESVTFAAVELGTSLTVESTDSADLTDCSSSSGWPIASFSYLLFDYANSRGTCHGQYEIKYRTQKEFNTLVTIVKFICC